MKESAQKIMNFSAWIKEHAESDNEFFQKKIPSWYEGIYIEKQNLQAQYNRSIRLIGYLYFYYDGYRIQNKLEALFQKMKDTEWDSQTYAKSWNDLWKFQNQGAEILREIKKEIDALSTLWPRPVHWIQINWNLLDLQTYSRRRWIRIMVKRKVRLARMVYKKHSNKMMIRSQS